MLGRPSWCDSAAFRFVNEDGEDWYAQERVDKSDAWMDLTGCDVGWKVYAIKISGPTPRLTKRELEAASFVMQKTAPLFEFTDNIHIRRRIGDAAFRMLKSRLVLGEGEMFFVMSAILALAGRHESRQVMRRAGMRRLGDR